jgi:hypothetical protein
MITRHENGDVGGCSYAADFMGDLVCKAFLDLEATGEVFHDAAKLGEAEDFIFGNVADSDGCREREEVMLAEAPRMNILDYDHLISAGDSERCRLVVR